MKKENLEEINKRQSRALQMVNREVIENISLTMEKELKENPELLDEAENYYPMDDEGKRDDENGDYPEIYEFWSVSKWLYDRLKEHGEIVFDYLDFYVWCRQTTGQAIGMDCVIDKIANEEWGV